MLIISDKYLDRYKKSLSIDLDSALEQMDKIELTPSSFTFYTSVAVMASSRIEGEQLEIDSYVKHKMQRMEYLPNLVQKPNDLYVAYEFAKQNKLAKENLLRCHGLLSKHLLPESQRGVYRKNEMVVLEHKTGRIQYEAAPFALIASEMNKLWEDIGALQKENLAMDELFYYASYIHIVFVNIHPFNDGNGRAARLLEKWFLADRLGEKAWYIKSEKYYYHHVNDYYASLNKLGMFYDKLEYAYALSFLLMLPNAVNYEL